MQLLFSGLFRGATQILKTVSHAETLRWREERKAEQRDFKPAVEEELRSFTQENVSTQQCGNKKTQTPVMLKAEFGRLFSYFMLFIKLI